MLSILLIPSLAAALITPSTTLTASSGAVTSGTAVTLTAYVHASTGGPYGGQVAFCDASAAHCTDIHQLGVSSLLAGYAYLKVVPGPGMHSYKAVYLGNTSYAASTSGSVTVSVSPLRATATSIAQSGSAGSYSLFSAVSGAGSTPPTGSVSFLDTTNSNYVLGTGVLGGGSSAFSLVPGSTCSIGQTPGDVAVGDFNGDGLPDLAVVSQSVNGITICLAHLDGTFSTLTQTLPANPSSPSQPVYLIAGDFNNDGIPDLVVYQQSTATNNSQTLTLLKGNGDGTFTGSTNLSGSSHGGVFRPVTGDFDGDGNADLAYIDEGLSGYTVMIYRGKGDGTFYASSSILNSTNGEFPLQLAAADVNNDGRTDLILLASFSAAVLHVALGNSDGSFTAKSQTIAALPGPSLVTADFNQDGNLDLGLILGSSVVLLNGNGDGTFAQGTTLTLAASPSSLSVGDFNGDGHADLAAILSGSSNNVAVYLGVGDGTFATQPATITISSPAVLASADFTGNGFSDLAVLPSSGTAITNLLGNPTSSATVNVSNISPVGIGNHQVVASYPGDTNFAPSTSPTTALSASQITGQQFKLSASPASSVSGQSVTLSAVMNPYTAQGHTTDGETVTFSTFPGGNVIGQGTFTGGVATLTLSTLPVGTSTIQALYHGDTDFASDATNDLSYTVAGVTSTTLAITSAGNAVSSVPGGTAITLTATVLSGSTPIRPGLVAFCDAAAPHCTDIHRLGTAQLTAAGTATLQVTPPIGAHSYKAVFFGTAAAAASSSSSSSLAVTGLFPTRTTLTSNGSPGNYTLAASVVGLTHSPLSGTVTFADTSNGNASLGSAAISFSSSTFALGGAQTLTTGLQPKAVIPGDFNGDGKPDFATADYGANTVTIQLGNGDGTFSAATSLSSMLQSPDAIAVGDFNGDGKQDLAVANYGSGTVSIFLGNGDGTFTPSSSGSFFVPSPQALVVGDFNNDGIPDLAVASAYASNTIYVRLGRGDGTFTSPSGPALTAGNYPAAIVAADFNNDGLEDIAVANVTDRTITVFFGAGAGQFPTSRTLPNAGSSYALATADLDADGNADLIALASGGDTVTVLRGDGTGNFTALASPVTATNPMAVAVGDLNGDGIPDLVTANNNAGSSLDVFLGNGDGTFQAAIPYATGIVPYALALADFNGDGSADPVTANYASNNASVLLAQTTQTAIVSVQNVSPTGPGTSHAAQANYPGDPTHAASTSNTVTLNPLPYAAAPTFSPAGGTYPSAQTVTLASNTPTPNVGIYYTTDGSTPTLSSPQYTAPISVTATETIRAFTAASGYQNSPVSSATYTIVVPPAVTTQPASQTINSGSTATLTVSATGTAPLSYQWYAATGTSAFVPIAGATFATYTTPALTATALYQVQVSNASGVPATSATATITVVTPPTITNQPASQTINSGASVTLAVSASGTAPLTYQWYSSTGTAPLTAIPGATASSYTTFALTATTYYQVQVANASGVPATSAVATVTVITKPTISVQPASQTVNTGSPVTLSLAATGTSPTFQWYAGSSGNTASPISGATGSSYTTPPLTATSSFWARAANQAGTADSATATITVIQTPTCTLSVQPTSTALTVVATSHCTDPQSQALTETIAWGDGSSSPVNLATNTNSHPYTAGGTYTVTLSATNTSGLTGTATQRVSPNQSPVCTLGVVQGQISNVLTQYPVTVTASCTDPQGPQALISQTIAWGDGSSSPVTTATNTYSHTYTSAVTVTYNVVLTGNDASGLSGSSAPQPVQIVPAQPIPAGGSTPVSSSIAPPPLPSPAPVQVTFVCSSVSVLVNSQTVTTIPSTYGISCTSPSVQLTSTSTYVPVNVTISTSSGAVAAIREPDSASTLAFCALPLAGLAFLLPLAPGKRRRFTALALACVLCLSLSACGGSFQAPAAAATPTGLYYVTLVETVVSGPAPTGFVQTSLIVPLPVTH